MGAHDAGRCPTCKQPTTRAAAGKLFPFCAKRCWAIDLGRWLGEEYRVADANLDGEQAPSVPTDDPER